MICLDVLCIDPAVLKVSENVQKDVDLVGLMTDHVKTFTSLEDAEKAHCVPLTFCISVRSIFDNTAVVKQTDKGAVCHFAVTDAPDPRMRGDDLIMYVSSYGVFKAANNTPELAEIMTQYSQFQYIGLYNPDPGVVNPVIYSHVLLADIGMNLLEKCLRPECSVEKIAEMQTPGTPKALSDTLIIVNKEDEDNGW